MTSLAGSTRGRLGVTGSNWGRVGVDTSSIGRVHRERASGVKGPSGVDESIRGRSKGDAGSGAEFGKTHEWTQEHMYRESAA